MSRSKRREQGRKLRVGENVRKKNSAKYVALKKTDKEGKLN